MQINIRSKTLEITPALREYLEKRLSKFEKMIDIDSATATFTVTKDKQKVEVMMTTHGVLMRGEEETYDMYTSIDNVVDKIERQIHKYKTRLIRKGRSSAGRSAKVLADAISEKETVDEYPVKIKRFTVKPMPVEEAIMQMNLLGHSFFVFTNCDNDLVSVVYQRKDGDYGLLEPEL
ncbi:MAG: ribosome hibernation-promoting factor, HPF/YfiA family [Bacillota bacterium]|jgi:putative sigma-54 modulation protein